MNWKEHWDNAAIISDDTIAQVRRKDFESTFLTINHIKKILRFNKKDIVLDICCGNGFLTKEISQNCYRISGVDISDEQIKIANQKFNAVNIDYQCISALDLNEKFRDNTFDKIYLQFSFQYFDQENQGEELIEQVVKLLKPNGLFFIGDIPQYEKWNVFYNTILKKLFYLKWKIQKRKIMGKFWKPSELDKICKKLNIKGSFLKQVKELPYAHYRFDYLIEK